MMRASRERPDPARRAMTGWKLAVAAVGIFIWGYGVRVDDAAFRWAGIGILAAAVLLRFVPFRRDPD